MRRRSDVVIDAPHQVGSYNELWVAVDLIADRIRSGAEHARLTARTRNHVVQSSSGRRSVQTPRD